MKKPFMRIGLILSIVFSFHYSLYADDLNVSGSVGGDAYQQKERGNPDSAQTTATTRLSVNAEYFRGNFINLAFAGDFKFKFIDAYSEEQDSTVSDLNSTNPDANLYQLDLAYGEVKVTRRLSLIAGRQMTPEVMEFPTTFDGATLVFKGRLEDIAVSFFLLGGKPISYLSVDDEKKSLLENMLLKVGGKATYDTEDGGVFTLNVDYRFLKEMMVDGEKAATAHLANLVAFFRSTNINVKVFAGTLNRDLAKVGGRAIFNFPKRNAMAMFSAQRQMVTLDELLPTLENPYAGIIGTISPNTRINFRIEKTLKLESGDYTISASVESKQYDKEGTFAHNMRHGQAAVSVADVARVKGLFVNFSVDFYANKIFAPAGNGNDRIITATGSIGFRNEKARAELCANYMFTKYDYYTQQEISNVRTVCLRTGIAIGRLWLSATGEWSQFGVVAIEGTGIVDRYGVYFNFSNTYYKAK